MRRRDFLSMLSLTALSAAIPKKAYCFLNGLWRQPEGLSFYDLAPCAYPIYPVIPHENQLSSDVEEALGLMWYNFAVHPDAILMSKSNHRALRKAMRGDRRRPNRGMNHNMDRSTRPRLADFMTGDSGRTMTGDFDRLLALQNNR